MGSLHTLPDEIRENIAEQLVVDYDGLRAFCKVASLCTRLRRFPVPQRRWSWDIS